MIVVELVAAINDAGTLQTFLLADEDWATGPADTPANTHVAGRLEDPGNLGVTVFSDGRTGGGSRLETGSVVVQNSDGELDSWRTYGFDGRPVVVRVGPLGGAYPADFTTLLTATVDGAVQADELQLTLNLKDKAHILDRPVQTTRYAGTNVGPTGLEGTANDLKGKPKPRTYGAVQNVTPLPANTSKLIYQVSDGAVAYILPVDDSGVALANTGNLATSALLAAAAIGSGDFKTCTAEGLFRLGSSPVGQITAWVGQGAAAANRTTAQLLKALALAAGVSSGDINASDVAALDAVAGGETGIHVDDERTYREAMDELAASAGAFYYFDLDGTFRMGQLAAPGGAPAMYIEDWAVLDIRLRTPADTAVPVWDVRVDYSKNYTVQTAGLAGSVSASDRAFLGAALRSVSAQDAAVKTKHLLAGVMAVETRLVSAAAAQAEANRLLALHKVRREMFDVFLPLELVREAQVYLGRTVQLTYDRFGLDAGKLFLVLGLRFELAQEQAVLTLWG